MYWLQWLLPQVALLVCQAWPAGVLELSSMSWACSWTWGGYLAAVGCECTHMTVLHCLRMLPSTWSMAASLGRPLLLLPSSTLLR